MTQQEFDAQPAAVQAYLRSAGLAPGATPPAAPAQSVAAAPLSPPDLDGIPEQSSNGATFLPFSEYDFTGEIAQVQHRFSEQSGPNFYSTITVDTASESALQAGITVGSTWAFYYKYNPNAFGKDRHKSDGSLRRYAAFIRQVCGLPTGASINAASADLIERSKQVPTLGIKVRVISIKGNERRDEPGTYFYNQTVIPLG